MASRPPRTRFRGWAGSCRRRPMGLRSRNSSSGSSVAFWTARSWSCSGPPLRSSCSTWAHFFGMYAFARVTQRIGRRPTFAIFFLIAMAATALAFWRIEKMPQDLWMVVLMGAVQLSVFGGYAIYFPELFPTRLRSTGTSFCYNVGRYVSAAGPFTKGLLTSYVFVSAVNSAQAERSAGVSMCTATCWAWWPSCSPPKPRASLCRSSRPPAVIPSRRATGVAVADSPWEST